jgi:hypothetical protein
MSIQRRKNGARVASKLKHPARNLATPLAELRFARDIDKIHWLGSARVWYELLRQIAPKHNIGADVAAIAANNARLTREVLLVVDVVRMLPLPLHTSPDDSRSRSPICRVLDSARNSPVLVLFISADVS